MKGCTEANNISSCCQRHNTNPKNLHVRKEFTLIFGIVCSGSNDGKLLVSWGFRLQVVMAATTHRKSFFRNLSFGSSMPPSLETQHTVCKSEDNLIQGYKYKRKMKAARSWIRLRPLVPTIIGLSLGFALSMLYIPVVEQQCLYDIEESKVYIMGKDQNGNWDWPREEQKTTPPPTTKPKPTQHKTVAPKATHFNFGLRPFYVASELGHKEKLLVGVLTSEDQLDSLVMAINNTWGANLPSVIFFIPYSRDVEFHDKYTKVLGFPVVQLDVDADEEPSPKLKMSFEMLKYMHSHYINNFEWFFRAEDSTYLKSEKLIEFLSSVNSSEDGYIGRPAAVSYNTQDVTYNDDLYRYERYCLGGTGVALSRTTLLKLAPNFESCTEEALTENDDVELGRCLYKNLGLQCTWGYEASDMFYQIPKGSESNILELVKERRLLHAITMHPIKEPVNMYHVHRYFTELELNKTFIETRFLQTAIKDLLPFLPDGVPEKHPTWPIGFQQPFHPKSRFEVVEWQYFTENASYGFTEVNPEIKLKSAFKKDIQEVTQTAFKMLTRETPHEKKSARLINGYRRVDPRRGAEYILDVGLTGGDSKEERRRVHMLRPFTKVENIQMATATEQRGVHLVVPVGKNDVDQLEKFLQMYQQVCLLTGENVVLLTVFVNVRDDGDNDHVTEKFADGKALIARYKQKYTWAQLPWIQIGVRHKSLTLLADIVTMKLPANALIFLTSLDVEFTVGFLNRCRVNALNGQQVFFPVPFAYYDPKIVFRQEEVPSIVPLHRDMGHWDTDAYNLVCFNNKDYKENRIHSEDFLKEKEFQPKELMKVFVDTKLHIFRAVDVDLRKRYHPEDCSRAKNEDRDTCLEKRAEAMASRSQLAMWLFEKERDAEKKTKT